MPVTFGPGRYLLGDGGRRAGSSLAYALGDSRTAQNIQNTFHYAVRGNGAAWVKRLSAGQIILPLANINGGSGETAATIRANRYPTAKASSAKVLILLAGVNQGTSLAQDLADVTYMAQDFAASASDRVSFVYDEMPVDTGAAWNGTQIARQAALRDGIRALSRPSQGVYVFPSWRIATGGNDGNTPLSGFFLAIDGIHPITKGSMLLGQWPANLLSVLPAYDPYASATFATGTTFDGANFAGNTGDALSVATLSAANIASSRMVVSGATTWAELTLNGTAQGSMNRSSGILPANVIPGVTRVSALLKIKLSAGLANVGAIQLDLIKQSGNPAATNAGIDMQFTGTSVDYGALSVSVDTFFTLQTPPVLIDADATSIRWRLLVYPQNISSVAQTMTGLVSAGFSAIKIEP